MNTKKDCGITIFKTICTLKPNRKRRRNKSAGFDLTFIFIIVTIAAIIFTIYIGYRASISDRKLFSVSLLALFAGVLFESCRVNSNWKLVIFKFVGAYALSFFSFLTGRGERKYSFENHIEMWPYYFLFVFLLISAIVNKDKVTDKLTEGITLLFSLAFIYYLADINSFHFNNWFLIILVAISLLFALFSIINAFTSLALTKMNRLWLSIWTTVVVFVISIDNIINVYKKGDLETSKYFSDNLLLGIQYFLLGVSGIYIMQNFILLSGFLPSRNGNYKRELRENVKDHISRYSDKQVDFISSVFCILFSVTIYYLNYRYHILPRNTMIWLVVFSFPIILKIFYWLRSILTLNVFRNKKYKRIL